MINSDNQIPVQPQENNHNTRAIQPYQEAPDELAIDLPKLEEGLKTIKKFQALVKTLTTEGVDYGVIPGTSKPTLLKPGAEKIAKLMKLADSYEILEKQENYDKPFFAFTVKCSLTSILTGRLISEGVGQCNSYESKYRYRWVFPSEVPSYIDKTTLRTKVIHSTAKNRDFTMYRLDNEDVCSQVNTILKMAKKRALVDAALSAGRLSEIFTQDIEDMEEQGATKTAKVIVTTPVPKPTKPRKKVTTNERQALFSLCTNCNVTSFDLQQYLHKTYNIKSTKDIKPDQYKDIVEWIKSHKKTENEIDTEKRAKDLLENKTYSCPGTMEPDCEFKGKRLKIDDDHLESTEDGHYLCPGCGFLLVEI